MSKNVLFILCPLYWPSWLGLAILWLIIQLPHSIRCRIGRWIGQLLYIIPTSMKHTTHVNLALCFPELGEKERLQLAKKNFESLGLALIESAMAWWFSDEKLKLLYQLQGFEHIEKALAKGKGVILIAPHFTCLEIVGRLIGMHYTFGVMYRPHKKRFIAYLHERFRKKHYVNYIPSNRVRQLLHALKQNQPIWYAYDIDGGINRRSVFAPFFGKPTASLTTVSRIAQLSEAAVIPMSYFRRDDNLSYEVILSPPIKNFPSDNLVDDAAQLNAALENAIRQKPEQYVWQYKRFKTRPPGERRFYYMTSYIDT